MRRLPAMLLGRILSIKKARVLVESPLPFDVNPPPWKMQANKMKSKNCKGGKN